MNLSLRLTSSVRSRWYTCTQKSLYALCPVPQKFLQRCLWNGSNVHLISRKMSGASSFTAVSSVWLSLFLQIMSQAPQHLRSSEMQTTCDGWFACQSVLSLHSGMSRAVHPQEFWRWLLSVDTHQSRFPAPLLTFCSRLTDSVRMMACVVWLSSHDAVQWRSCLTASTSAVIVKLGDKGSIKSRLHCARVTAVSSAESDMKFSLQCKISVWKWQDNALVV